MRFLVIIAAVCCCVCFAARTKSRDEIKRDECYAQEKIYHKPKNQCYKLLTKGPCSNGYWYVLDKPREEDVQVRIEAKCVQEKCRDGEYYWPDTRTCVKAEDKNKYCSNSEYEELRHNFFGEGECTCKKEPPSARLDNNKDNPCHILYTQGPCRAGEVFGFRNSASDEPSCLPDPCYVESRYMKRMRLLSQNAILVQWRNNTCYELNTQGPCPEGQTFKVHSGDLMPKCVLLTNAFFDVREDCFQDEFGACQREINFAGNKYKQRIIRALGRKRRKSARARGWRKASP